MNLKMKKIKVFTTLFFSFLLLFPLIKAFNVYFLNNTLEIDKENTLVINATDYSGKIRGIINFGNFIIKIECAYLDHNILKYNILPTTNKGFVYLELENGTIINKQYEIKGNKTKTGPLRIFYIEEKSCVFSSNPNINTQVNNNQNKKLPNKERINENDVEIIKEKHNYWPIFLIAGIISLAIFLISFYFYKLGRIEEKLEQKIDVEIKKIPKEVELIMKEEDYKKKAFKLYNYLRKLNSSKNDLKIKEVLDKLYFYSFKKELNEEEKNYIDEILNKIERGEINV
jgi:hypothetical protein